MKTETTQHDFEQIIEQIVNEKLEPHLDKLFSLIHELESYKEIKSLRLCSVKGFCEQTSLSESYVYQLLKEGKLTRYKINSSTCLSMCEFENSLTKVSHL